jgi:hypothetical protein
VSLIRGWAKSAGGRASEAKVDGIRRLGAGPLEKCLLVSFHRKSRTSSDLPGEWLDIELDKADMVAILGNAIFQSYARLAGFKVEKNTDPCRACVDGFPLEVDACPTCGRVRA